MKVKKTLDANASNTHILKFVRFLKYFFFLYVYILKIWTNQKLVIFYLFFNESDSDFAYV